MSVHTLANIPSSPPTSISAPSHFETIPGRILKDGSYVIGSVPRQARKTYPTNFSVPFSPRSIPATEGYVPQVDAMRLLEEHLIPSRTEPLGTKQRVVVLWGPGGIGKTRLVAEFVSKYRHEFSSIFFLDGSNRESLLQRLKEAFDRIWNAWPEQSINRPEKKPTTDEEIEKAFRTWFEYQENSKWLIVFDNVDVPPSEKYDIKCLFPDIDHGNILITTRLFDYTSKGTSHYLRPMDDTQASKLLGQAIAEARNRRALPPIDTCGAAYQSARESLLHELDGIPLAIIQAGSFVGSSNISVQKFLEALKANRDKVLQQLPTVGDKKTDPRANIRTTWKLSFEQLAQAKGVGSELCHNAAKLLLLIAQLDGRDIWFGLLKNGVVDPQLPPWLAETLEDEITFSNTIQVLQDYSLVRANSEEGSFSMHSIIQACCRSFVERGDPSAVEPLRLAVTCVGYSAPFALNDNFDQEASRFAPHVDRILERQNELPSLSIETLDADTMNASDNEKMQRIFDSPYDHSPVLCTHPLTRIASFLASRSEIAKATSLLEAILHNAEAKEEISWVQLGALRDLGWCYYVLDRGPEAEDVAKRAYEGFKERYGNDHIFTIRARGTLATALSAAGKFTESLQLALDNLEREKSLKPSRKHAIATAINNLAFTYKEVGDNEKAVELLEEALKEYEAILPPTHAEVLKAQKKLIDHLEDLGRWDQSIPVRRDYADRVASANGERSPEALEARRLLAGAYGESGDPDSQELLRKEILSICEAELGESNPRTMIAMRDLAQSLKRRKQYTKAMDTLQKAAKMAELHLPDLDPVRADMLYEMAQVEETQTHWAQAEQHCVAALEVYEKTPEVRADADFMAGVRVSLARYKALTGDPTAAESVLNMCGFQGDVSTIGKKFPKVQSLVFIAFSDLGVAQYRKEQYVEAKKNLEFALAGFSKLPGKSADVEIVMDRLVDVYDAQKRLVILHNAQRQWEATINLGSQLHPEREGISGVCLQRTIDISVEVAFAYCHINRLVETREWLSHCRRLVEKRWTEKDDKNPPDHASLWNTYRDAATNVACLNVIESYMSQWKASVGNVCYSLLDPISNRWKFTITTTVASQEKLELDETQATVNELERLARQWQQMRKDLDLQAASRRSGPWSEEATRPVADNLAPGDSTPDSQLSAESANIPLRLVVQRLLSSPGGLYYDDVGDEITTMFERIPINVATITEDFGETEVPPSLPDFETLVGMAEGFCEHSILPTVQFDVLLPEGWELESSGELLRAVNPASQQTEIVLPRIEEEDKSRSEKCIDSPTAKRMALHLFPDREDQLHAEGPDNIVRGLPMDLQEGIMFTRPLRGRGCWTFTPKGNETTSPLPLTIAGRPVVIPVEYRYPILAGQVPPPDPHPKLIDPTDPLDDALIHDIMNTFEFAQGFYLLINGMLQILVADGFDYCFALSHRPRLFGGLKVSYVRGLMIPTGAESLSSTDAWSTIAIPSERSRYKINFHFQKPAATIQPPPLGLNSSLEARLQGVRRSKTRFTARVGLRLGDKNREGQYLTIPTHILKDAAEQKRHDVSLRSFSTEQGQSVSEWKDKIDVWAHDTKIGKVGRVFDRDPCEFPSGYDHDLALIELSGFDGTKKFDGVSHASRNFEWISKKEWDRLRQQRHPLRMLGMPNRLMTDRNWTMHECEEVGKGIIANREEPMGDQNVSNWAQVVSRFLLYRTEPPLDDTYSGVPLYVERDNKDPAIVGFQSFFQASSQMGPHSFDVGGEKILDLIRKDHVSFFGAFEIHDDLHKYNIL